MQQNHFREATIEYIRNEIEMPPETPIRTGIHLDAGVSCVAPESSLLWHRRRIGRGSLGSCRSGRHNNLTDVEKGYTFTATTNKQGEYILPSIPPSVYTLSAEMNGFDKAIRTGIKVDVTSHVTVNMSLKVAGATQTVQVSSQTSTLETQDATTGQVINKRFIEDLPNTNRYVMDLVQLAPGVTNVDDTCGVNCTGTNFISNGSRNATADVLMDGASITNMNRTAASPT